MDDSALGFELSIFPGLWDAWFDWMLVFTVKGLNVVIYVGFTFSLKGYGGVKFVQISDFELILWSYK